MIGFNSVRSGCTTSFIPAGGIMTAPMLGHGCVCNYPMFASLGLYHFPEIEKYRPLAVTTSWVNQAEQLFAEMGQFAPGAASRAAFATSGDLKIDSEQFQLLNSTVQPSGSALLFSTKDEKAGYAVRQTDHPLRKASFTFSLKHATEASGKKRHGNAFFVCGPTNSPEDFIECRLYYGGRSSMMIAGSQVKPIEEKIRFDRQTVFTVTVTVDCENQTVTFETAGTKLSTQITGHIKMITHYGYGGANSDNLVTNIAVR